jgi:hypothetical protein
MPACPFFNTTSAVLKYGDTIKNALVPAVECCIWAEVARMGCGTDARHTDAGFFTPLYGFDSTQHAVCVGAPSIRKLLQQQQIQLFRRLQRDLRRYIFDLPQVC